MPNWFKNNEDCIQPKVLADRTYSASEKKFSPRLDPVTKSLHHCGYFILSVSQTILACVVMANLCSAETDS